MKHTRQEKPLNSAAAACTSPRLLRASAGRGVAAGVVALLAVGGSIVGASAGAQAVEPVPAAAGTAAKGSAQPAAFVAAASLSESKIVSDVDRIRANGVAEATIKVSLRDDDGNPISPSRGERVVIWTNNGMISNTQDNGDGTYTAKLVATAAGSATLSFTIDGLSAEGTARVWLINATPPPAPQVGPSNGSGVNGRTNISGYVTVSDESGRVLTTGYGGRDGAFSLPIEPRAAHGTVLTVTAIDTESNVSVPTRVIVDAVAPDAPHAAPSDGLRVSGAAEPGASVVIRDGSGLIIGSGVAAGDGSFDIGLVRAVTSADRVDVAAIDAAGNESDRVDVLVNDAGSEPETGTEPETETGTEPETETGTETETLKTETETEPGTGARPAPRRRPAPSLKLKRGPKPRPILRPKPGPRSGQRLSLASCRRSARTRPNGTSWCRAPKTREHLLRPRRPSSSSRLPPREETPSRAAVPAGILLALGAVAPLLTRAAQRVRSLAPGAERR